MIRRAPPSYGAEGETLRVGGVYNLESSFAAALIAENCAELYDSLSEEEKKRASAGGYLWQAPDRDRRR